MNSVLEKTRPTAKRFTANSLLGVKAMDNIKLAKAVEAGLSYSSLERLGRLTGLPLEQLRVAVRITPRTLVRRKQSNKLSPEESDRLVSLSRLLSLTFELFEGEAGSALHWFTEPNRGLGGLAPLHAASTETGSREVEDLIGRLEHGVFS